MFLVFVAPFMGAWIEIYLILLRLIKSFKSHPLWVRGLKSYLQSPQNIIDKVAPFMGAWIEILYPSNSSNANSKSHPLWVRGLK